MSKWSKYILLTGVLFGVIVGIFFTYVGWNLHPVVFEKDHVYSFIIFISWFFVTILPFILTTGLFELYRFFKKRP